MEIDVKILENDALHYVDCWHGYTWNCRQHLVVHSSDSDQAAADTVALPHDVDHDVDSFQSEIW